MDILLSLFVPSKIKRFKNMSGIVAVAIFAVCAYILCIPSKIINSNTDKIIEKNYYSSGEFVNCETTFDYTCIKAINPRFDGTALVVDSSDVSRFAVITNKNIIYLIFDQNYNEFNSDLNLYEMYEIEPTNNTLALLFAKEFFYLCKVEDDEVSVVQGAQYQYMNLDFANTETASEFLGYIGYNLATLYSQVYSASFAISVILMVVLLPFILTFVMWLLLRKKSIMTEFKEYFNVASICTVAPSLLFFGLSFITSVVMNFYTAVFVIFYIFTCFKINTEKK